MSRSGYTEDCDGWSFIRWRGAVASAIRGKRGQAFLREMLAALDALPDKRLIEGDLERGESVCAIGAVGRARGIDMVGVDHEDRETVAGTFGIPFSLACEVMFENDEHAKWDAEMHRVVPETDEERFTRMHRWIERHLIEWEQPL